MDRVNQLLRYLESASAGQLTADQGVAVQALLASCWSDLKYADGGGMHGGKLSGRMEALRWQPPALTFTIERHGGTVQGSSRAELQDWSIDLQAGTATYSSRRHRQLRPAARKLDVKVLSEELASVIAAGRQDDRVDWLSQDSVRIKMSAVIPATVAQTTQSRRRRFREQLAALLHAQGWHLRLAGTQCVFDRW